jgi:hypothetical protein
MKFLFLLWIAMAGIFDASAWATAAWCLLYLFINVSWRQCFWITLAIHLVGSLFFVKYIEAQTREGCLSYIRRKSKLLVLYIASAPILSILPTVAAIGLLSLLEFWTQLETHWLHTWLLVTCLVFILLRASEARKVVLKVNSQLLQRPGSIWKLRSDSGARIAANVAVEQSHGEGWLDSRKPSGKFARSARQATNGPRIVRVIDV